MKRFIVLIYIITQTQFIFSQNNYYQRDSMMFYGANVIDGGAINNAKQCEVKEAEKTLIYSPKEVHEYGFSDGRVYISRTISIQNEEKKVFLEILKKGKLNLYYFKDKDGSKYFLEKDSGHLVELKSSPDKLYKATLEQYVADCSSASEALKHVPFNKNNLNKFFEMYNSCSNQQFPYIKYGVMVGCGIYEPQNYNISSNELKIAEFNNTISLNFGAFMDIPILVSSFSFHPEIYFLKNNFIGRSLSNSEITDIKINSNAIVLPILFRYNFLSLKFLPYLNLGGIYAYNFSNNPALYSTTIQNDIVEISMISSANIYSKEQFGYAFGAGFHYKINSRNSLFMEFRYNNLFAKTPNTYGNKSLQCIIGINL